MGAFAKTGPCNPSTASTTSRSSYHSLVGIFASCTFSCCFLYCPSFSPPFHIILYSNYIMPAVFKKMQMQVSKMNNNGYVPSTRVATPLNKSTHLQIPLTHKSTHLQNPLYRYGTSPYLQSGAKGTHMIGRITGVKSGCSCG